jgi:hypothetical protein
MASLHGWPQAESQNVAFEATEADAVVVACEVVFDVF